MVQKRTRNAFIGSPVERLEDLRFLRGRGQYVDDLPRQDLLHAVILRSSVAHGRIRSIDDRRRAERCPACTPSSPRPTSARRSRVIPMRQEPLPEFKPFEQPVIAHDKVRYVGEPIAVVVADSAALAEDALEPIDARHRGAAGGRRQRGRAAKNDSLLFEATGTQSRASRSPRVQRRRRRGVQRRALRPPRALHGAALHGACPMEPRGAAGRMGRGERQSHRLRRGQGAVPQPPHPGEADRACPRTPIAHDRERRRRRLRRARRVLSGGLPDPVRGAPLRPAGEMDRGPPRAPDGHQPRPRGRMRAGDRLRARRHHPGAARRRRYADIGAYMRTNGAIGRAQHRAGSCPGPIACRTSSIDVVAADDQQDAVGTYRGPGRFEADFFRERLFDMAARRSRHRPRRVPPRAI